MSFRSNFFLSLTLLCASLNAAWLADTIITKPQEAAEYFAKVTANVFEVYKKEDVQLFEKTIVDYHNLLSENFSSVPRLKELYQKNPKAYTTFVLNTYIEIHKYVQPKEIAIVLAELNGFTSPEQMNAYVTCHLILHKALEKITTTPYITDVKINETFIQLLLSHILNTFYATIAAINAQETQEDTDLFLPLISNTLYFIRETVSISDIAKQSSISDKKSITTLTSSWNILLSA